MDFGRVDSSRLFAATPADVEKGSESELNGPEGIEGRNRENVTGLHGRGGSDGGHKQHAFIIRTFAKGKVITHICHS